MKKRKFWSVLLVIGMILMGMPVSVFAAGAGTAADPYQITTEAELRAVSGSGYYKLMNDITLTGNWTPISSFSGTLDGDGHTVRGLNINSSSGTLGLFATLSSGGTVKDLTIYGNIVSNYYSNAGRVGGFAGVNNGTISGCTFYGSISQRQGDNHAIGGIAGLNQGTISGCNNYADVTGISTGGGYDAVYVGGITGSNHGTVNISNCVNYGTISGSVPNMNTNVGDVWGSENWKSNGAYVGGIAGDTNIKSAPGCSNEGTIIGDNTNTKVNLNSINAPEAIELESPISRNDLQARLPATVILETTGGQRAGSVTWDITSYNEETEDTVYFFKGTVTIPANVTNNNGVPLETTIKVTVGEATFTHIHAWSKEWTKDAAYHWHECLDRECPDANDNSKKDGYASHIYDQEVADARYLKSAATCEQKAVYYKSCICGAYATGDAAATFESGELAGHSMGEWSVVQEAKCEQTGLKKQECSVCGHEEEETIPALEHAYADTFITDLEPTCTTTGSKSKHCNRPGCTGKTEITEIPATGHTYSDQWSYNDTTHWHAAICEHTDKKKDEVKHTMGDWENVTPATCTTDGSEKRKCTECEYTETQPINKTNHNFSNKFTIDLKPTCTVDGSRSRHCTNPGCDEKTDVTSITKLGHDFTEWEEVNAPTCTETGSKKHTCNRCQYMETDDVPENGHSWQADYTIDRPATCTEDGSKSIHCDKCEMRKDSQTIPATGHSYAEEWTCNETKHWHRAVCEHTDLVSESADHTFKDWITQKPATCEKDGVRTHECAVCSYVGSEPIAMLNHEYDKEYTIDREPTCTTTGSKSRHCIHTGCDSSVDITEIPATGHSYSEKWDSDITGHWHSAVCEHKEEITGKEPHNFGEWKVEKAPSCEKDGSMVRVCAECGFREERVMGKTGHKFDTAFTVDKAASCTEKGSMSKHCVNEGCEEKAEITELPLTAHSWDEGKITVKPQPGQTGEKVFTCMACEAVRKEVLPALPYAVSPGQESTWKPGDKPLEFQTNGEPSKITGILVDGKEVEASNYTIVSGVVTLKKEYLETLAAGGHMLTVCYEDGTAVADFTIEARKAPAAPNGSDKKNISGVPQTADAAETDVWFLLLMSAGMIFAMAAVAAMNQRRQ